MNRNMEYEQLMRELEALPVPEGGIRRAVRRRRLNRYLLHPLTSIAAALALFVILVNASTTVAHACSRIPGLRELAAAVTFSRSLSDAVANEYVQPVGQEQTKEGITVRVEYLIVDQRTVTVFYRTDSDRYPRLEAIPAFFAADGGELESGSWWANDWDVPNGTLRSIHLDFLNANVPPALRLKLGVYSMTAADTAAEPAGSVRDDALSDPPCAAEFEFLLEFDPYYMSQGKHFETDAQITLDGQIMHITNVDVYPSYLSFSMEGDAANTSWLMSLRYYLVTDRGERFDPVTHGITATGNPETPEMMTFRADSTFFYYARAVTLYVTGVEWLDKDQEAIRIDLRQEKADRMPDGTELVSAVREDDCWMVTVLHDRMDAQPFMPDYYDAAGTRYSMESWTTGEMLYGMEAPEGYCYTCFLLRGYPHDEVWLTPRYTRRWSASPPLEAVIPLE